MSKRDYVQFARMLAYERNRIINCPQDVNQKILLSENNWYANKIADIFESDNPKFNRKKFLQYCGIIPFSDKESK